MMNSKLILGTVQFGLNYGINNKLGLPSENELFKILNTAKNNNIFYLDTAYSYGNAEERIGRFHSKSNSFSFKINTKLRKGEIKSFENEIIFFLERLKISALNTLFFHSLDDLLINQDRFFEYIKNNNKNQFKKIGVSVYTVEDLNKILDFDYLDVIQISFNIFDNESKKGDILKKIKSKGKEIHVRSCFLQGLFFKSIEKLEYPLNKLTNYLEKISKLSTETGMDIGQICMLYVLKKEYIDKLIIGVDSHKQLVQNINWSRGQMSDEIENFIDNLKIRESELLNPTNW